MKEINLNPIDEDDLIDKRNEVAENCFIEIDIALKSYNVCFGEDNVYDEISLLHTTLAYILSNHKNGHKLSNIDIEKFEIPNSPFKTEEGEHTDKLYNLTNQDSLHFITNMVMNSKTGFLELARSKYLDDMKGDLMIDKHGLLFQFSSMLDRAIL